MLKYTFLFAVLLGLCAAEGFAQVDPTVGTRDTIVVIRRDTVVVVQRDTVFYVEEPRPSRGPRGGREDDNERASERPSDRSMQRDPDYDDDDWYPTTEEEIRSLPTSRERINARRELVKRNRAERRGGTYRGEKFAPLIPVRVSPTAWAYHLYPSRMVDLDFPAVSVGASYVRNGKFGITGIAGILVDPNVYPGWDDPGFGDARVGLRGIDIGAEVRWLLSPNTDNQPLYLSIGLSYAEAIVEYNSVLVPNAQGTFSRLANVNAAGRRIEVPMAIGWDGRWKSGFALDVAMGLDIGAKGLFSDNADRLNQFDPWEITTINAWNAYAMPTLRIGIGIGKW